MSAFSRRSLLRAAAASALAIPLGGLLPAARRAYASPSGGARRLIVFYFPDGVAGPSADGSPSLWHLMGSERSFTLNEQLQGLGSFKDDCVFLNGLSSGPTDSGSHPGGAKKILTAVDGGNGESIDQYLARTAGAGALFRHVYLGAMANYNNASGDKHISYPSAGNSATPEDSPMKAFERLFGKSNPSGGGSGGGMPDELAVSVLDANLKDLQELTGKLGSVEKKKLDLHLEALREVERRVKGIPGMTPPPKATCSDPRIDTSGLSEAVLYDPANFPKILRAQLDLMVQAMACGLTKVGVVQASFHTSELIMSRFPMTEMYDPKFDMRSHQASHYGPSHDRSKREFRDYFAQRRWWVQQFAYLIDQLKQRPEGDGTMLDYSLVVLCSEISDGNTHSHDNLPFGVAGRGGGALSTGRLLQYGYRRHGDLLVSIARAMKQDLWRFGDASSGPLPGFLSAGF
jgi:hypothetical protein